MTKEVLIFGRGDIIVTALDNVAHKLSMGIAFKKIEERTPIGSTGVMEKHWPVGGKQLKDLSKGEEPEVVFIFDKSESVQVVIDELEKIKISLGEVTV